MLFVDPPTLYHNSRHKPSKTGLSNKTASSHGKVPRKDFDQPTRTLASSTPSSKHSKQAYRPQSCRTSSLFNTYPSNMAHQLKPQHGQPTSNRCTSPLHHHSNNKMEYRQGQVRRIGLKVSGNTSRSLRREPRWQHPRHSSSSRWLGTVG